MRLVVLAIIVAATAATVTTAKGGDAREPTPETAGLAAGERPAPSAATGRAARTNDTTTASHVGSRLEAFRTCRTKRGYPVNTQTPSERELRACQRQLRQDAIVDTHVAIRLIFPRSSWDDWFCIVEKEGIGRWPRRDPIVRGAAGERGSFQIHPVHYAWVDEELLDGPDANALYGTIVAQEIAAFHRRKDGSPFYGWLNSARKCGIL